MIDLESRRRRVISNLTPQNNRGIHDISDPSPTNLQDIANPSSFKCKYHTKKDIHYREAHICVKKPHATSEASK